MFFPVVPGGGDVIYSDIDDPMRALNFYIPTLPIAYVVVVDALLHVGPFLRLLLK